MKLQSVVNLQASGKGYILTISDELSSNTVALTAEELMQIVSIGNHLINN